MKVPFGRIVLEIEPAAGGVRIAWPGGYVNIPSREAQRLTGAILWALRQTEQDEDEEENR